MSRISSLIACSGLLLLSITGLAPAQDSQRFSMERTDGGFLIMDSQTGSVAFCRENGAGIDCREAALSKKEPALSTNTILEKKLTELEARVEKLERGRGNTSGLPSDSELERTLNFMERFFQRFIGIVKGLESEDKSKLNQSPQSNQSL